MWRFLQQFSVDIKIDILSLTRLLHVYTVLKRFAEFLHLRDGTFLPVGILAFFECVLNFLWQRLVVEAALAVPPFAFRRKICRYAHAIQYERRLVIRKF